MVFPQTPAVFFKKDINILIYIIIKQGVSQSIFDRNVEKKVIPKFYVD